MLRMTPVGHTLVGAAIGMVALPNKSRGCKKYLHLFSFIVLANIPDLPVPMWGHNRYDISHSIFMSFLLITLLTLLISLVSTYIFRQQINRWILFWETIAVLSHLLLDSFYNHGLGVVIFWPFSTKSLVLPISWLSVQKEIPPPVTMEMLRIWLYEFITFGPLLLVVIWFKKLLSRTNA